VYLNIGGLVDYGALGTLLVAGGVVLRGGQQAVVNFAQRNGQGLFLYFGLYERTDILQEALTELGVVGIDLPGTTGGIDHQRILRIGRFKQLINGRVGDAFGLGNNSGHLVNSVMVDFKFATGLVGKDPF